MSVTVNLPEDLAARLEAEAARRGVTVDELVAEAVTARLPGAESDPLEAFIGCGRSGRTEPFDLGQARRDLAERKLAEGA